MVVRLKTYNEGANDERTAIMAKLRRDKLKAVKISPLVAKYLDTAIDWVMNRAARAGYAPGGIGRKLVRPTPKTRPVVKRAARETVRRLREPLI